MVLVVGWIPGWGAKVLHASWQKGKKERKKWKKYCNKFNKNLKKREA